VTLKYGATATAIDMAAREVTTSTGKHVPFSKADPRHWFIGTAAPGPRW
jgi:hypothetical protein